MKNQILGISMHEEDLMQMENENHQKKIRRAIAVIDTSYFFITPTTYRYSMIIDPMFPDCKAYSADSANTIWEEDLVFLAKSVIKNG